MKQLIDDKTPLMATLNFTNEDLQANREGYMSKRQRQQFSKKLPDVSSGLLLVLGAATFVAIGMLYRDSSLIIPIAVTYGIAVVIVFVVLQADRFKPYKADIHKGNVVSRCGIIECVQIYRGKSIAYQLIVEGEILDISNGVYKTLESGKHYCIYFTPISG